MSISQIGIFPGPGGGTSAGSATATAKRAQNGRGMLNSDGIDHVARSLIVSGLLRGRNLDGNNGDPEIWAITCPAIVAEAVISARGGVQHIVFAADIWECDVFEVQAYDFQGSTPASLAKLQGGIYTELPQPDGTPFADTAVLDWTQSYAAWGGGYRVLALPAIRQRLQPVDFKWIPKVKPDEDFTFRVRIAAYCDWWMGSADPAVRVD